MFSDYFGHYFNPLNVIAWAGIFYIAPMLATYWLGISLIVNAYRWFNNA